MPAENIKPTGLLRFIERQHGTNSADVNAIFKSRVLQQEWLCWNEDGARTEWRDVPLEVSDAR
jgi:hypothetical protein